MFVFAKALAASPNVVHFATGDFIMGTGTLLDKALTGGEALHALCLFNDFNSLYHVYGNPAAL